jgi:hypothetical protein
LGNAINGGLTTASPFNTSGKTAAISSALDSLASGLVAARTRNDIATEVVAANRLVEKLIDRLVNDKTATGAEDNVLGYYLKQLSFERFSMHTFYENNIGATQSGVERLQAFQYYATEATNDAKLDQRIAAAQSYKSALTKLKKAHDDIAKSVTSNDFASMQSIAQGYIQEYQPQIDGLRKAFK